MECKNCNNKMLFIKEYGDGYYEPREVHYQCNHCGTELWVGEEYGYDWSDGQ